MTLRHIIRIEGQASFVQKDEDASLLQAALRSGVGMSYECSSGGCGSCRFELLSGEVKDLWPDAPGLSARDRRKGLRLACQNRACGPVTIKANVSPDRAPRVTPKVMRLQLESTRDLTHDMREFRFRGAEIASFVPGQYALLRIANGPNRCYSMANPPNENGVWEFQIKRVPGGRVSNAFFELTAGATVIADAPYGLAHLVPDSQRLVVCIAGGSGLAPMISIARAVGADPGRRLAFFYGGRTAADVCGEEHLAKLPAFGGNLRYFPVVSNPDEQPGVYWTGRRGYVHDAVAQEIGEELRDAEIYFAGPPPMTEAVLRQLMLGFNVPAAQIHFDRFF